MSTHLYEVRVIEKNFYNVRVEADSKHEAEDKIHKKIYDVCNKKYFDKRETFVSAHKIDVVV